MAEWQLISDAPTVAGIEILGSRWYWSDEKDRMICVREPFVSFWSPTLGKFYCDPTHFIHMPGTPGQSGEPSE